MTNTSKITHSHTYRGIRTNGKVTPPPKSTYTVGIYSPGKALVV